MKLIVLPVNATSACSVDTSSDRPGLAVTTAIVRKAVNARTNIQSPFNPTPADRSAAPLPVFPISDKIGQVYKNCKRRIAARSSILSRMTAIAKLDNSTQRAHHLHADQ